MEQIRAITYNILAQDHITNRELTRYAKVDPQHLQWPDRLPKIIAVISAHEIIALQEVSQDALNDILALIGANYESIFTITDKKHNIGIAIIYNTTAVTLVASKTNSSAIVATFKRDDTLQSDGNAFVFVNTHLRAGLRSKSADRLSQLKSTMKIIDATNISRAIICGDFNDDFQHTDTLKSHIHASQYTIAPSQLSFYSYDEDTRYALDQIIFMGVNVNVQVGDLLCNLCIPNDIYPSDHLPIMFTITYVKYH